VALAPRKHRRQEVKTNNKKNSVVMALSEEEARDKLHQLEALQQAVELDRREKENYIELMRQRGDRVK
jgi:hypothetical protein